MDHPTGTELICTMPFAAATATAANEAHASEAPPPLMGQYQVYNTSGSAYNDFDIILEPPLPRPPPCARFHHHRTYN